MSIFTEAYKLIKEEKIKKDFEKEGNIFYLVKDYSVRIYRKSCSWFLQCGCNVGVSNKPNGLCKHNIATIVKQFMDENKLEWDKQKY